MIVFRVSAEGVTAVQKHALTLSEVEESYGAVSLVAELREIGALLPAAAKKRTLLFDANEVARVWAEFCDGRYDGRLKSWGSMRAKREGVAA